MAMRETELKFQIPPERLAALRRAVHTASAQQQRLQAFYFDTPGRDLAAAGLAWRIRREGRRWVQTLKGRGDGVMQRLEHEVVLPRAPKPCLPDAALHAGTPAGEHLSRALQSSEVACQVQCVFATNVHRTTRLLRHGGAVFELALDQGSLLAGPIQPGGRPRRQAVCELEIELKQGPSAALPALAGRWVQRHGLWLDVRTKAEAGQRLAAGLVSVAAVHFSPPSLPRQATPAQAWSAVLLAHLKHLLPNQAELATTEVARPRVATAERAMPGLAAEAASAHLHQWRVAVRRLRSVLKTLGPWAPVAVADMANPGVVPGAAQALATRWRAAFLATSEWRDADVLAALLTPPLAQAGLDWSARDAAPSVAPSATPNAAPQTLAFFQSPALSVLVLDTLALALQAAEVGGSHSSSATLRADARSACRQAARGVRRAIDGFAALDIEQRHALRKQLKRLRYTAGAVSAVLPSRWCATWLPRLRAALEALGQANDLALAQHALLESTAADTTSPGTAAATWFARGWVQAQQAHALVQAQRALRRLRKLPASLR
jgi:triphosphatase